MVVPIFEPSTRAHARSNVIQPFEHIISVMANVAADDWIIIVSTMPTSVKISIDVTPIEAYCLR